MSLAALLGVGAGLTALIGGGGKTTLLYALAEELKERGSVVVTTSAKIRVPEHLPVVDPTTPEALAAALAAASPLCLGRPWPQAGAEALLQTGGRSMSAPTAVGEGSGKLAAPTLPFRVLTEAADFVLVEAYGSKGLPAKAHAAHEPVIPAEAGRVILVLGADAFGRPIREACHRPELYAQRAGVTPETALTPELAARVILAEGYGNIIYVNKCETEEAWANAEALAQLVSVPVAAGSLRDGQYRRL